MNNTLILNPPVSIIHFLKWKFNLRIFGIFSSVFVGILLIFYIFQVAEMTKALYLIGNYEKKISKLAQENKNLEISFFKTNSLENIETLVRNLNFEPVGRIHYIKMIEARVVTK